MIQTENIALDNQQRDKLTDYINEINDFLSKKYPIYTVTISIALLILILFLIFLFEDYAFSIILKLLTVLPLWAIVVINMKYYRNRLPAKRHRNLYQKILKDNYYQAIRVRPKTCDQYSDSLYDYFLFSADKGKQLLLRLQDFTVDKDKFPNDNFLIPPFGLLDVVGDIITCDGERIEPTRNNDISRKLIAFRLFEKGRVMITDQI